jgi:hypothetical protein
MRHKNNRWARANSPAAVKARVERMRAKKLETPRCYDAYRPGDDSFEITIKGPGWCHVVRAVVPCDAGVKRSRSDQHAVDVNGERWADKAGLVAIFNHARSLVPRRLTRNELASL